VALLIEPDACARVEAVIQATGGAVLPFQIDRRGVIVRAR
jgi:hypothetical protein